MMHHNPICARRGVPRETSVVVSSFSHRGNLAVANISVGSPVQVVGHEWRAVTAIRLICLAAFKYHRMFEVTEVAACSRKPQQKPAKRVKFFQAGIRTMESRNLAI